jgi:hypothetical protein
MSDKATLEMREEGWALIHLPEGLLVATHEEIHKMQRRGKIWSRSDNPYNREPEFMPHLKESRG